MLGLEAPAWGRVDTRAGEGRVVRLEGQVHTGTFTKSYSRDELRRPDLGHGPRDAHLRLMSEVTDLLNRVRNGLTRDQERRSLENLRTEEPEKRRWLQSQTLLNAQVETRAADPNALRQFFAAQSQRAATDAARERVPAIGQLTSLKFDFDLGPGARSASASSTDRTLHYGLIVKDIEPDLGSAKRASTSTSSEEFANAGRARVRWGIGPLEESEDRPIMAAEEMQVSGRRSVAGILIPSTKFKGIAQPEGFDGGVQGALPAWRFGLTQEDQLYNVTYRTRRDNQVGHVEHAFSIPLMGSLSVSRKVSETLSSVETSASGVLVDRRLPHVILRYLHLEERYRADLQTQIKGHNVGASARTKVRGKIDRPEEATEAYSITFSKNF